MNNPILTINIHWLYKVILNNPILIINIHRLPMIMLKQPNINNFSFKKNPILIINTIEVSTFIEELHLPLFLYFARLLRNFILQLFTSNNMNSKFHST